MYMYEGGLKGSYADSMYDLIIMVEFDQMWFIFQHSLPCGPYTSSIHIAVLGFPWYRSSHPDSWSSKKSSAADMTSSLVWYCFPAKCLFHVGEQKIVRWCQIRRIWSVITQFKATVMQHSNYNHRHNCVQDCPGEKALALSVFHAVSEMY